MCQAFKMQKWRYVSFPPAGFSCFEWREAWTNCQVQVTVTIFVMHLLLADCGRRDLLRKKREIHSEDLKGLMLHLHLKTWMISWVTKERAGSVMERQDILGKDRREKGMEESDLCWGTTSAWQDRGLMVDSSHSKAGKTSWMDLEDGHVL